MFLGWIGGLMQWKIISFCTPDSFWWFIIVKLVPKHTACTFKNNTCHVLFCFLFIYICFLKILVDQRNMSYVQVWWKFWWNQRKPNILWLMILTMALYWAFCYDKLGNNWWDKHELHTCIEFCHKKNNKIIRFVLCYKNLSQMFSSSLFAQSTSNGCFIMCCHLFVIFLKSLNLSSISAHHSLQCRAHVFSKKSRFCQKKDNWKSIYNPPI